jgi:hypothetical protein
MSEPLAGWTGEGLGHGVTTTALYARAEPEIQAAAVALWQANEPLILWAAYGGWYLVTSFARKSEPAGWSSNLYIQRTA